MENIGRDFIVIAVHGEGDRATVNSLQQHRNNEDALRLTRNGADVPDHLMTPPDEAPDVLVVLRDADNAVCRVDWPVTTWDEVDFWKQLLGYDEKLRHWKTGGKVRVNVGV